MILPIKQEEAFDKIIHFKTQIYMGRFSSKFSPTRMAHTAKQLFFAKDQGEDLEVDERERDEMNFNILESSKVVSDKGKKKRVRDEHGEGSKVVAVREKLDSRGGEGIRLFGKDIRVGRGESSRGKGEVERVFTLGELIKQDRIEVRNKKAMAVRSRTEPVRHYTAVTRAELSPGVGLLEGRGDNFRGSSVSPSSTISHIFSHFFGCFSPAGLTGSGEGVPVPEQTPVHDIEQTPLVSTDLLSGDQFSFVIPPANTLQPYDAVEEWWPRRSSPSLQHSVTYIDPYIERHPVWFERYCERVQLTYEAGYGGMSTGGGSGETETFPPDV